MVLVLFGVSGAGKTEVGQRLARYLGWAFHDADRLHSPEHVRLMRDGIPLTDADRGPWLDRVRALIARSLAARENAVVACSALKRAYRQHLKVNDDVTLVHLRGDYALIEERLRTRHGHFMNPDLLRMQFEALELPTAGEAIVVDVRATPEEIAATIRTALHLRPGASGDLI